MPAKRKRTKWTPHMVGRMGVLRARGLSGQQIIEYMQRRYLGVSPTTITDYLGRIFGGKKTREEVLQAFDEWKESYKRQVKAAKEQRKEALKKAWAATAQLTFEQSMARRKKQSKAKKDEWAALPENEKRARIKRMRDGLAGMTPEQWSAKSRKSKVTQLARLTREQRGAIIKKGWITRKQRLVKGILYVKELPVLIQDPEEIRGLFEQHRKLVKQLAERYERREDYEDVLGETNAAAIEAITKWDRKIGLEKLIADTVSLRLIKYFGKQKVISARERLIEDLDEIMAREK